MSFVPEDLLRSFELRVEEQTQQAQRLSAQMQQSTATVESPDGEVTVTVDSTGGLSDLRFRSPAERLPLERLATLVLDTSRRAQAEMARKMSELVSEMYGSGSATAEFVSNAYAERFPSPPASEREERR
ncbi:MAG TPA: YbaB/EbfC family nucleoid-associated protein [Planosporangium sp.]|jgi:DNA-binding protein YbaB|nr:YbaB/EbfC family nucleoid-associated protein [Planosporangium sp.]